MKYVFGIFDKVGGMYGAPMFVPNSQVMVRSLGDELKRDPSNVMAKHPKDFCLHEFGLWDEESGKFELHSRPALVVELEVLVEVPPVSGEHVHQVGMP